MLLKTRKFCLDQITKLKKLLTFKKKPSVEDTERPVLSYAELLDERKRRRQSFEKIKAISKSEFQLCLDTILEKYKIGETRWMEICELFFQHPESYVDKKYAKVKNVSTKKSIFRKRDDEVLEPFIVDYKKPIADKKQKRINEFLEELYDNDQQTRRDFADVAANNMLEATKAEETHFVDKWEKYLKRTGKDTNIDSFKTFLTSNQKFTKAQLKRFEISAIFHDKNLVNYGEFKKEMERVKNL